MDAVRIGLVGDYDPTVRAHLAIPRALGFITTDKYALRHVWLPTRAIAITGHRLLDECDGLWVVPGSPYESMDGALLAIQFARQRRIPFLGTCGGFQHAVIEFTRNVLGQRKAEHEETSPNSTHLAITKLSCSMVGVRGKILIYPDSHMGKAYGQIEAEEEYHCNYGLNPSYRQILERSGVMVSATDESGEVRAIELLDHPYFVGTLFQPELAALSGRLHPVIDSFVRAATKFQNVPR